MVRRILLVGLALTLWFAVLAWVVVTQILPGTDAGREIWRTHPLIWWPLVGAGPAILLLGAAWAARAKR